MSAVAIAPPDAATLAIAAAVCARIAAAVTVATLPAFPGVSARGRLAVVVALSAVAWPAAARPAALTAGPWPLIVAGEVLVGGVLGTAIALVVGAAGWAGTILGSVSGLSWADDFDPAADGAAAGIGRLAWWIGVAAFVSAGGQLAVIAGLLDSFATMPIGMAVADGGISQWLVTLACTAPTTALALALTLALPALAAVVAFHLASAICLRAVPFSPGAGLLQGLAALVLLAALGFGLDAWAGTGSTLVQGALEGLTNR